MEDVTDTLPVELAVVVWVCEIVVLAVSEGVVDTLIEAVDEAELSSEDVPVDVPVWEPELVADRVSDDVAEEVKVVEGDVREQPTRFPRRWSSTSTLI